MSARLLQDRHFFDAVKWNPFHKIVMDHRNGQVYESATNAERAKRKLPTPWRLEMLAREMETPPVL